MTSKFSFQVTKAGGWTLLQNLLTQSISLLRVIVLARLISPADFGVFAVALVALAVIEAFSTTGIQDALIQRQGDVEAKLNVAWTVQLCGGVLLALVMVMFAGMFAKFMGVAEAVTLIQIIGLVPLLRSFESIGVIRLHRGLDFKGLAKLALIDAAFSLLITIGASFFVSGQYALVAGIIGGALLRTAASYLICGHIPRLAWDKQEARSLFDFGKWITVNRVLFLFLSKVDLIVISKILGATSLGVYQMTQRVSEVSTKSLSAAAGTVAFSAYSRIQYEPTRLKRAFLLSLEAVSLFALPIAVFIGINSDYVVKTVLGDQWHSVTPILPWLMLAACIRAVGGVFGSFYKAIGKPKYDLFMNTGRGAVLCILAWPLTEKYGLTGIAATMLFAALALVPFMFFSLRFISAVSATDAMVTLVPATLVTLGIVACGYISREFFEKSLAFYACTVLSVFLTLLISYVNYIFNRRGAFGVFKILRESRR